MWARTLEVALACWLAVSPFVFGHGGRLLLWWHDLACALVVLVLATMSFHRRLRGAHLGEVAVAAWLIVFGYVHGEAGPASQNHIIVGLLLLMLAIVPSEALRPPTSWRRAVSPPGSD